MISDYLQGLLDAAILATNKTEINQFLHGNEGEKIAALAALIKSNDTLSSLLTASNVGMQIPKHDYYSCTRIGSTNNISVVTYKLGGSGGTVVATLTLTYFGSGVADDDTVSSATLAIP